MNPNSIFSRYWWAVCLRTNFKVTEGAGRAKIESIAAEMASVLNGTLHKTANLQRRGAFITPAEDGGLQSSTGDPATALIMLHTEERYFPIGLQDIETGPVVLEDVQDGDRDYPRMINDNLYQYPLLAGFSNMRSNGAIYVLSCPYFQLLRQILKGLRPGRHFSSMLTLDVEEAFKTLGDMILPQGEVFVKSGRMVISGIEFIRTAEFSGANVIASPLYLELRKRTGVKVYPKACRLGRKYAEPVGGNRRRFVCWFDQQGNFRFTPGEDAFSTLYKFVELLSILGEKGLLVNAETRLPPPKTS